MKSDGRDCGGSLASDHSGTPHSKMMSESTGKLSVESPAARLRKRQKNDVFEATQAVGLDPNEFDLQDDAVEVRIKHKRSLSCFIIGGDPGHYVGRYVVGDDPEWPFEEFSWRSMIPRIRRWLEEVKRDLETPDLWAEFQRETELLEANFDDVTENSPFTPDEQKVIAGRLQELAEHTRHTYSLSEAQMRILDGKLDYLVKAAGRLGRIDWRNAFAGAILGFIFTAALPPEAVRDMILVLSQTIGHLYGLLELPKG